MRQTVRFADLKAAGIVGSWQGLKHLLTTQAFPPGFKVGPQTRLWWEDEILSWLESRRVDPNVVQDNDGLKKARAASAAKRAAAKQEASNAS